jgi:hypothetical protein
MAYQSIQGTASGRLDLLSKMKDFLVNTVGWRLHDDQSADAKPYYVFMSAGESGAEDIYLRFQISSSSGRIEVAAFQYWDNTSQTGVNEAFYSSYTYIRAEDTADFIFWLYADLDHVFVVSKIVSTYYGQYSGSIKRFWSSAVAITQTALITGNAVVLPVNDASIFTPDQYYIIKDNSNIERIRITAIDTASTPNTVTIEALTNDYAAGAKIGEDPQPVITGYYNMPSTFYAVNKFDGWSSSSGQRGRCGAAHGNLQSDSDPEHRYETTILFPWLVSMNGSDSYQELRGELIEIYATGGANVSSEDTVEIGMDSYRVFNLSGGGWCAIKE